MVELENDWQELLASEFASENYLKLRDFLKEAYQSDTVYPPMEDIFTALRVTSYADTKVVILGQDPYHGPDQAQGLSFSAIFSIFTISAGRSLAINNFNLPLL